MKYCLQYDKSVCEMITLSALLNTIAWLFIRGRIKKDEKGKTHKKFTHTFASDPFLNGDQEMNTSYKLPISECIFIYRLEYL